VLNAYKAHYGFSTTSPESWSFPLAIDGQFGNQTEAAVVDFQNSVWADGIGARGGGVVGDRTWSMLGFCESYPPQPGNPVLADDIGDTSLTNCPPGLALGDSKTWVEALQMRLNQAYYYGMFPDTPDDFQPFLVIQPMYISSTEYAVVDFQSRAKYGAFSDGGGAVGNRTWSNLGMCW
jgi:peptidoglycan hydrolase-like protein with peptidoglycan-binding domain